MELPPVLNVTGQDINISDLTPEQIAYYKSLSEKIFSLYKENGEGRQIFGLSGPAGSGKSVVGTLLGLFFESNNIDVNYVDVGLDGFHYTNDVLESMKLKEVKGRYDTYNVPLLTKKLKAFKAGEKVTFPSYSRTTHNPIPDYISVSDENSLLLLEGQWLLRRSSEWEKIRDMCTYQFAIEGDISSMRKNVIERHVNGGRTRNDAETFYEKSDLVNTNEIINNSVKPDEKVLFYKDI